MQILTFFYAENKIRYTSNKLYNKKFIWQSTGVIEKVDDRVIWSIHDAQNKNAIQYDLEISFQDICNDYQYIFNNKYFAQIKQPDVVLHKISIGSQNGDEISRLTEINTAVLAKFANLAPNTQIQELQLAGAAQITYKKAKHYACFNDGFQAIDGDNYNSFLPFIVDAPFHATDSLIFASINKKIPNLIEKKVCKGKWIILNLEKSSTSLCGIKSGKARYATSSELKQEINSYQDYMSVEDESVTPKAQLTKYTHKIAQSICSIASILNGIDGIIFTGKIGVENTEVRNMICTQLEWLGIHISNKLNSEKRIKISKKSSNTSVFVFEANPESRMLELLSERL